MISLPDNAPNNRPQAADHLPHTQSAQFCFYSYGDCLHHSGYRGTSCLEVSGLWNLGETVKRQKQMCCRVFTFQARSHVPSCRDTKAGTKSGGQFTPNVSSLTICGGNPGLRVHRPADCRHRETGFYCISASGCNL